MQKRNDDLVQLLTPDFIRRNEIMGAWLDYTPTITSGAGAFTLVTAEGRYKVIGKTCFVNVTIRITNAGTASGSLRATLPRTASASAKVAQGVASRSSLMGSVTIATSATVMTIVKYDATTLISNGIVYGSAVYEI
jgi:hypothetical protein